MLRLEEIHSSCLLCWVPALQAGFEHCLIFHIKILSFWCAREEQVSPRSQCRETRMQEAWPSNSWRYCYSHQVSWTTVTRPGYGQRVKFRVQLVYLDADLLLWKRCCAHSSSASQLVLASPGCRAGRWEAARIGSALCKPLLGVDTKMTSGLAPTKLITFPLLPSTFFLLLNATWNKHRKELKWPSIVMVPQTNVTCFTFLVGKMELDKCLNTDSIVSWLLKCFWKRKNNKTLVVLVKAVFIDLLEFASHSNSSGPRIIHRCFQE